MQLLTQSVVQRLCQRFLDTRSVEERPKSGRPRNTSAVDDRYNVTMSGHQRFDTVRTLNQQFLNATGITICEQTIRNRLHDNGIHARRSAVRPPLTRDHRTARRQFAAQYEYMPFGSLRKILFTDESRFCFDNNDGRNVSGEGRTNVLLTAVLLNMTDGVVHLLWYEEAFI